MSGVLRRISNYSKVFLLVQDKVAAYQFLPQDPPPSHTAIAAVSPQPAVAAAAGMLKHLRSGDDGGEGGGGGDQITWERELVSRKGAGQTYYCLRLPLE